VKEILMGSPAARPLAVVTGASSGIGYELAVQFAEHDYDLVVAAEDQGIHLAAQELGAHGVNAVPVKVDLATYNGVEDLYASLRGRAPDAVAINAGVGVGGDFARQTDLADELRLISLNVTSSVHLAKRVLQDMIPRHAGKILFTSSIAATMPGPYEATYAASKAFLLSFGEAIRHELRDTGITVTTLMPGPTETEFFERAGLQDTKLGSSVNKDDPADVAREGYEALMAGKDKVVAGSFKNKVQGGISKVLPETSRAKIHGSMSEPGSADSGSSGG
jgi:short-subunit dehydrogenase